MAKRRKKSSKSQRCKNYAVYRANADCSGRKGKNACHSDYVKIGNAKYTTTGKRLGTGSVHVAVCKLGRSRIAMTPGGGANVKLRRMGK